MKPNTQNLAARVETLAARSKEAAKFLKAVQRAETNVSGIKAQVDAIKVDGLADDSPVVKLRNRTAKKLEDATLQLDCLKEALAREIDGPLGQLVREALEDMEGTSGAGVVEIYSYAGLLPLHDTVCDPDRLPSEVRIEAADIAKEREDCDDRNLPN